MARPDRFARGSDHTSFSDRGYAAVAFREANENFEKQHSALDTVDGVDFAYLAQNTRVNAVSIAALALAPPAPVVTNQRGRAFIGRQPSGYDAHLQWLPSPGATAIESTGARRGRTTGASHVWLAMRRSSLWRAFLSTTTSSASPQLAPQATKAWSALTSSDVRNGDL